MASPQCNVHHRPVSIQLLPPFCPPLGLGRSSISFFAVIGLTRGMYYYIKAYMPDRTLQDSYVSNIYDRRQGLDFTPGSSMKCFADASAHVYGVGRLVRRCVWRAIQQ